MHPPGSREPTSYHIAAGFEELRLSGARLDASVAKLLSDTAGTVLQVSGIAPERCAMDAILKLDLVALDGRHR